MAVALVTVIPKHTHPGQTSSAVTLGAIATLYFRHQFAWSAVPMLVYQVTSLVLVQLPHTEAHKANAKSYLILWWVSMLPRFLKSVRVSLLLCRRSPCLWVESLSLSLSLSLSFSLPPLLPFPPPLFRVVVRHAGCLATRHACMLTRFSTFTNACVCVCVCV